MKYNGKNSFPPMIRGEGARSNAGFQENISREKALGKDMKQAEAIAYGEAAYSYKNDKAPWGKKPRC